MNHQSSPTGEGDSENPGPLPSPSLLTRLNRHGFRLVMVLDLVVLYALTILIMLVRFGTTWPSSFPLQAYFISFAVASLIFLSSCYFGGLYDRDPRLGAPAILPKAGAQAVVGGGVVALLNLALTGFARELGLTTTRALPFPFINLVVYIVLAALAVAVNRWLVDMTRTRREGPPRVVLAGETPDLDLARRHVDTEGKRIHVVGTTTDPTTLVRTVEQTSATDVVLVSSRWLDDLYPETIIALDSANITTLMRVSGQETMMGLSRLRQIGGLPFVLLRPQTMSRSELHTKRALDLLVLVVGSPLWLAAMLFAVVYQLAVAGRPLLYRQSRVGVNGETFDIVKFRTMRVDAEDDDRGARLATDGDDRIIAADGWVRATRLDEVPQLWNILKGEMSFVGPRPERPELTKVFERRIAGYARRYEVPPGLTGLAQIHGRYHTDAAYKLGYDLQYLVNWSPLLDLEIMARTIWVVVSRRI